MCKLKRELLEECKRRVVEKLETGQQRIESLQQDLLSETKSTAGDKHETGRAMLHLEIEKAGKQLSGILAMKETLEKINFKRSSETTQIGSLVQTNLGAYFLSISLGPITVKNKDYFVVSISSPIGKQLLGKKKGDSLSVNGRKLKINAVS